ncbi:AIP3-domain-containing protein [Aureobasidium subglaciale]|nr:AIP3-domain-containing protein [Aureobasidium subglaciale]KAI5231302.1 AIP3-domain-containing protein [Aureobasidium subglaciale]KAI5234257.1 AIP3-domain-containing protein [Aureobasidium subglaciale]KAI5267678.1 AIP3-domain-containing protein [Aureobasidium subglaciale]
MASEDPSVRSSSGSRSSAPQQLSTIEKSVTHLLVATKQLLETLTQWSRNAASESEVSDVYVRLGYEFNIACRAFNSIGVDTQDLGPVPDLLRGILEETLSQEASQQSLDRFLPRIRDIIINLLHGLKKKQQRLRQRTSSGSQSARQASAAESAADDLLARQSASRSQSQRVANEPAGHDLPPRSASMLGGRSSPRKESFTPVASAHHARDQSRDTSSSDASSMSSNALQNMPVIAPYPQEDTMPAQPPPQYGNEPAPVAYQQESPRPTYTEHNLPPPPPPPPPKQQDALAALQRGGELERRASRRFSAYQISKHLGSSNGVPMIPSAQNSPIPNRGQDTRESMKAVRTRSYLQNRQKSAQKIAQGSPSRRERTEGQRAAEQLNTNVVESQSDVDLESASPMPKTPEDKLGAYPFPTQQSPIEADMGATVNGPVPETILDLPSESSAGGELQRHKSRIQRQTTPPSTTEKASTQQQFVPESSPQPGKELTLFLQYKSKIKKFVLPDGGDLSIARLQLAFIEKFAWNTHNNGNDLPEIYLQDPVSGVRHELEDLADIKDRSVLVLNVEQLDEVKKHFDDSIGGIKSMIEGLKAAVDDQQSAIHRVSERQQDAAKEMAAMVIAAPRAQTQNATPPPLQTASSKGTPAQLTEVQSLRRELAVVRQTYTSFVDDINASMSSIRTKAATVKSTADKTRVPSMSAGSGRTYVNGGKKSLSDDSEKLVTQVDDLQDTVEDLRKDVVQRGVRPLPRQLDVVSKDISTATSGLKKLQEFLKREKPIWTKIWEKELQVVCEDRDLLTMQEELCIDLEDDLEKAAETFALVEQATRQQNLQNTPRSSSRTLNPVALERGGDPQKARTGVLGEVRALQPNHESRLEAIERAEKARQRELEERRDGEFQKELSSFVEEGKLKKSGGVEEAERLRKLKDERSRKENFELLQQRERDRAAKRAADAAAKAAAAATEVENTAADTEVAAEAATETATITEAIDEAPEEATDKGGEEAATTAETSDAAQNALDATTENTKPVQASLELPPSNDVTDFDEPSPAVEFVDAREVPPTPAAE